MGKKINKELVGSTDPRYMEALNKVSDAIAKKKAVVVDKPVNKEKQLVQQYLKDFDLLCREQRLKPNRQGEVSIRFVEIDGTMLDIDNYLIYRLGKEKK